VVKGPASALYGQSSPGGLVAMTSKLPLDEAFYGAASATYGSYNLYRVDADVGGKLSDAVSVRLYGSVSGADTQQYYGSRARQTLSGTVTFKIDPATTLTVLGAWSHDPRNGNYSGAPGYGTLFDNPNGKIDTRYADGEPSNYFRRNQEAGTYILTHDFGASWHSGPAAATSMSIPIWARSMKPAFRPMRPWRNLPAPATPPTKPSTTGPSTTSFRARSQPGRSGTRCRRRRLPDRPLVRGRRLRHRAADQFL
jgi:outer membrane receptor protein involved in Fe transport